MPALSGTFDPYAGILPPAENGYAKGSGNVNMPSDIGVPGISPELNLGAELGAGNWRSTPWVNGARSL
jgi:hypothetical protein